MLTPSIIFTIVSLFISNAFYQEFNNKFPLTLYKISTEQDKDLVLKSRITQLNTLDMLRREKLKKELESRIFELQKELGKFT